MCPHPNILSTKSDYFCGRTNGRTEGRTDSVLRPPTYKALRAKIRFLYRYAFFGEPIILIDWVEGMTISMFAGAAFLLSFPPAATLAK